MALAAGHGAAGAEAHSGGGCSRVEADGGHVAGAASAQWRAHGGRRRTRYAGEMKKQVCARV